MIKWGIVGLYALCVPAMAVAQSWDINLGAGLGYSRLIPVNHSTRQTPHIRYSFMGPGVYLSPELCINVSGQSKFSFGMQFSENRVGLKFKAGNRSAREVYYESFDLYNFSVGYYGFKHIAHGMATLGWLAKAGLAYGYNTGGGEGGEGSSAAGGQVSASIIETKSLTGAEVMPGFWMPTTTLGITVGPNSQKNKIADMLTFLASLTIGWKNIYTGYAKVEYAITTLQSADNGTAQYQGMPLLLQFGASYSLFRFRKNDDY